MTRLKELRKKMLEARAAADKALAAAKSARDAAFWDAINTSIEARAAYNEELKNLQIIQYNSFNVEPTFASSFIIAGGGSDTAPTPKIQYNSLQNSYFGVQIMCIPDTIKYNNITNMEEEAIRYYNPSGPSTYTVTTNYISDCNGEVGVDSNGSQSNNIIYSNPQTTPILNAGSGW